MAAKVLILSPYGETLAPAFTGNDQVEFRPDGELTEDDQAHWDWIISYGYRKIIKEPFISNYRGRLLNLHISYLPFNRGADPNFWSWFDDTPKGVTLHEIDRGLDTGRLLLQSKVTFGSPYAHTLRTSYDQLHRAAVSVFQTAWPSIRNGGIRSWPQEGYGTYHRSTDKDFYMKQLPHGWDTSVEVIASLGRYHRDEA